MIIGIGGVSSAGKTTLAERLKGMLESSGHKVDIIQLDDYVKAKEDIPTVRDRIDWEHPNGIDYKSLCETIALAKSRYDVIIAEGHLIYCDDGLNKLFDKKIFLTISKETFLNRRKAEKRWGEEPDWYLEHVWESYNKYGTCNEMLVYSIETEEPIPQQQLEVFE